MPEPLKNHYSEKLVKSLSREVKKEHPAFNSRAFNRKVLSDEWESLELKARMRRIVFLLGEFLPKSYTEAINILTPVSEKFSGLGHMLFPDFVEQYGLNDYRLSMKALAHFTSASSAEFAIRPFIMQDTEKTMKQMKRWSRSQNEHLRRLASEGCRPRLPWAMALPEFKKNPQPVLDIILNLMDDESLYVRRSVANNLNDISKDNPDVVVEIATEHLGRSKEIDWVIKHACRGLLKQGDKKVLPLFGYSNAEHVVVNQLSVDKKVSMGSELNFNFDIKSKNKRLGKLRLEFVIDFMKSNGKTSPKIFKIGEGEYAENSRSISKYFSFKPITTRRYYPGEHKLFIVINGEKVASKPFELTE
ncbi:DNA alkylation repair protein [Aliikangiella coralliicola]|uniref:DNA alkylation repair protein n=1 Tax=Aliikangiella coralliicola TaxID=2592383 RepID=A0A545UB11_9GAMM|nr:DNA alkylation repair protein [Aliikangiella coralliicola]TQV86656.1 DNA alkylation repair protein [Aliikangiella coralliicola]